MIGAIFGALAVPGVAQDADLDTLRSRALELVNADRDEQGLPALSRGETLDRSAQAHAEDMLRRDFYAHTGPDGNGPRDRFLTAGGSEWELVAENIARCRGCGDLSRERIEAFQEGWMNSPEHRANILREGLTRFGFGAAAGEDEIFAVQTFAGPGMSRGKSSEPAGEGAITDLAVAAINAARDDNGVAPLEPNAALTEGARSLVPEDLGSFTLEGMDGLRSALPAEGPRWRAVQAVAAACGGCGARITEGDVEGFVSDWLAGSRAAQLLREEMTDAGMVVRMNGAGRKVALLLLGAR
ncbi:hypothetical protein OB2597_03893 [Pseudooceanicola batsensis HTCC2597]|uniref:SCP domain-containing protein n=2 Tax=Pseudooceanicola batsensis TaxID=314255 RepID=A3U2H5_PSEBH|nr:hypothetical protein OB2597_03893 [Pseudooceanicola batsensis HTCC2597]